MSANGDGEPGADPLARLRQWIEDARRAKAFVPEACALATVSSAGDPSARMIRLKRTDADELIFTTALWTRKAQDLFDNPRLSLLFHWPELGRQVHVSGRAQRTARDVDERLFAERPLANRVQTHVSRQGELIDDLDGLRRRAAELYHRLTSDVARGGGRRPTRGVEDEVDLPCPDEWGGFAVQPTAIEFWHESPDRIHERTMYVRGDAADWDVVRLAP